MNFSEMQELVVISFGGRDDTTAMTLIKAAINFAIAIASLAFKPTELREQTNFSYIGNAASLDISGTNWAEITMVWNTTDSRELRFIPYDRIFSIVPSTLTAAKFYSLYGDSLFVRGIPTTTKALVMSALVLPADLTSDTEDIPFTGYDSYIQAIASGLTFMAFEEGETAASWQKVAEVLGQPLTLGAKAKDIITKKQAYFDLAIAQAQKGE